MKTITIVIPAYNEEKNILPLVESIKNHFPHERYLYELIFVDDGSTDGTLNQIKETARHDDSIFYLELSRNFGHQNALKAGLDYATGDCAISMDCDMQHPPRLINNLIEKWEEGYDIVYTRREDNQSASFLKRKTSNAYYNLLNWLAEVKIEKGTADFRLMDRRVVDIFIQFDENDLFIRGLIPWIGFKQIAVDYEPDKRLSGKTKYSLRKMFVLAISGITSLSIRPLYSAIYFGLAASALAIIAIPIILMSYNPHRHIAFMLACNLTAIVFFGGLQLTVLGTIGLYIGKTFLQVKHRPLYIVRKSKLPKKH
jgi:glycosyltransferase involved in cell wall biosynthesis